MDQSVVIPLIVTGGVAMVALAVAVFAAVRLNRLTRSVILLSGGATETDFVSVVADHIDETRQLAQHVAALDTRVGQIRNRLGGAIQQVGVVRYDAFADMGGHLSFSAAFLDEHGSGVVITCINGRTDARVYSKGVKAGSGQDSALSEEELAAITLAMDPTHVHHEMV